MTDIEIEDLKRRHAVAVTQLAKAEQLYTLLAEKHDALVLAHRLLVDKLAAQ